MKIPIIQTSGLNKSIIELQPVISGLDEQFRRVMLEGWEDERKRGIKPLAGVEQRANFSEVE